MKGSDNTYDQQVYYRIIALWILCEAMLGGVIHALHIPVSGLVVGSAAVVCICLIAYYTRRKGAIIKATIIVAIFKMMLSPQTPILAYAAVFFQGAMGEVIFWNKKFYRLSCLALGFLALLESGLQRIIVLTVIYGNNFWKVLNDFVNEVTKQKSFTNYSLYFITGYVLLHIAAGLIVGWWAGIIPRKIWKWRVEFSDFKINEESEGTTVFQRSKRRRRIRTGLLIIWILLILLYLQSYFKVGQPLLPSSLPLKILVRSVIIVLGWYFLVKPLVQMFLQDWLKKKQSHRQVEIKKVVDLLPSMHSLITGSWKLSERKSGFSRIIFFTKLVLAKSLWFATTAKNIFILTGKIKSGKTTALMKWTESRNDVHGILSPVINGKRVFYDIDTKESFRMEADQAEKKVLSIGRYKFSQTCFKRANEIIKNSLHKNGWLVIDEIGPLELRGEGFCNTLNEVLHNRNNQQRVLVVVRDSMVEKVKQVFGLNQAHLLKNTYEIEIEEKPAEF